MLGTKEHHLTDCLDRVYAFTTYMRTDEGGNPRLPDVLQCSAYARQTLDDIVASIHDPFQYRLLGLWLDVFQQPWAQPRTLNQLLDDLARAIGRGDLKVYLEDNPNWHRMKPLKAGPGSSQDSKEVATDGGTDEPRTQSEESRSESKNGDTDAQIKEEAQPENSADDNPHPGLHNREWDEIEDDEFTTRRQVDMDNLSESDEAAKEALLDQDRNIEKIEEVLSSGDDFRVKQLEPGDKLYGFDFKENKYPTKNPASPYWLDEAGYEDVKSKFYKDGAWDREGVKNYLALPCSNRANVIDTAEVTEPQSVVESTIGKATEQIGYTRGDYSTGMMSKTMEGGGTQVAPAPAAISDVSRGGGTH